MKRIILAIGCLALVGLLGITMADRSVDAQNTATPGASTASSNDKDTGREAYLDTLAEKLGVSAEQLQSAIDETNSELGVGGPREWRHGGDGDRWGFHRFEGRGHAGALLRWIDLAPAADFLGITEDELMTDMRSGTGFLEIAAEHGKTTDDIRAFLIQRATVAIDTFLQNAETAPGRVPAATPAA